MNRLQDMVESSLMEVLPNQASVEDIQAWETAIAEEAPKLADAMADVMLKAIKKDISGGLKKNRRVQREFEKRLMARWKKPLELLEVFVSVAGEAGEMFYETYRVDAAGSNDAVFEVLTRLHARACQISSAIVALLRGGYADDAHARWRALHEIAVVGHFISERGQEMAERYLLHDVIQRYQLAVKVRDHGDVIDEEPLSEEEFSELRAEREELVAEFGNGFEKPYGWAASAFGNRRTTFQDIEGSVDLGHWRPYYAMASSNVHANVHGSYFRLGLNDESVNALLAGPSIYGLADPGQSTGISLCQVTAALLETKSNMDSIVLLKTIVRLERELCELFVQVHRELEGLEGD